MSCWGQCECECIRVVSYHADVSVGLGGGQKMTFSTLPSSCIKWAVRDEDQMGSAS